MRFRLSSNGSYSIFGFTYHKFKKYSTKLLFLAFVPEKPPFNLNFICHIQITNSTIFTDRTIRELNFSSPSPPNQSRQRQLTHQNQYRIMRWYCTYVKRKSQKRNLINSKANKDKQETKPKKIYLFVSNLIL